MPRSKDKETAVLYARGLTKENLRYIKVEAAKGDFKSISSYLNALFDVARKRSAARK